MKPYVSSSYRCSALVAAYGGYRYDMMFYIYAMSVQEGRIEGDFHRVV